MRLFIAAVAWQTRAVLMRHLVVYLRNWNTAALPPIFEPVILLLVFGVGLGQNIPAFDWQGKSVSYLTYLAPGILAYTVFMTAFFQALFAAYIRMHFQKTWEGQLTTQIQLEHVIWAEILWAAVLGLAYAIIVVFVLVVFSWCGWLDLHWHGLIVALPLLFVAGLSFATLGLLFTAIVPTVDHMNIPFYLLIMPLGFASSTYFPLDSDVLFVRIWLLVNPLHHLAEGIRQLLLFDSWSLHLPAALFLFCLMILFLMPNDLRLLRRRVLGEKQE